MIKQNKEKWLNEARVLNEHAKKVNLVVNIFSTTKQQWISKKIQSRTFDSVILPADQKKALIDDVTKFNSNEAFYLSKNIPYRRGYFFYGPPGTGKTSISFAMATATSRPIYIMPTDLNVDALTSIPPGSLILFEDADKFIATKDTAYRIVDAEPIPLNTSYPTIDPNEHNIWKKAIRHNEDLINQYRDNYSGLEANFDASTNDGVTLLDSLVEGVLTSMKSGYAEPKKAKSNKPVDVDFSIEYEAAETDEEFEIRRKMYKNIIKEVNKLRQEHYDSTRFDQEKVCRLLQIIDGAEGPYNTIFVMTTNNKNDIQSAMIRAGRMDVINEIGYLTPDTIEDMFNRFEVPAEKRQELLKRVQIPGRGMCVTGAELQGVLI
jgi:chaperone BCS1